MCIRDRIHQYIIMSAPSAAQYGALEGLKHCQEEVEDMRDSYMTRRNFCVKAFNDMGLETFKPQEMCIRDSITTLSAPRSTE